ncbi:MAG: glycosyltransferase family 4 protein [Thiohalomonadales bacterium]
MKNNKIIAYLAPEIPALSATFIYQEILQLKKLNVEIKPVSIHRPGSRAKSDTLKKLESETFYLYEQSFFKIIILNLYLLMVSPFRYFSVFKMAFSDATRIGLTTHIGKGLLYRFVIAAGFVNYLKNNNIGHIHSNFAHIPTDIAMYAAALHGVSFSFISHANDLFERGWLLKEKVSRAKFAVTISEFNKKFLIDKSADEEKINVIHCGVDTASFSDRGDTKFSNPPVLGALGRMVEKKGFDVLIEACAILKKNDVVFKLQIAGGGPLKQELENLANKMNLTGYIDFIDSISHEKVPHWIKSLDIFVLPCKKDKHGDMDGIPVVLMEAMLSGVPVITTRLSGIPELVVDEVTGLLCEPDDAVSLTKKIQLLMSNNELRKEIRKNAISKVRAEFELNENVNLLEKKLTE